jgi:isopentenyl-diphosphate Delta-isomerase
MEQKVILVDEEDVVKGAAGKMEVHEKGLLHRAFSVFIFNAKGEMLLQQRAMHKYHSGGLWTNACCSHPQPGEETAAAALRRLKEEMGFDTELEKLFDFVYKAEFDNGLTEHEFDHVYVGEYDGAIGYSKEEVMAYRYCSMQEVIDSLRSNPEQYTAWFRVAFPKIRNWWNERYKNPVA